MFASRGERARFAARRPSKLYALAVTAAAGAGGYWLVSRDRHGPAGVGSRVSRYLHEPRDHIVTGVALAVTVLDSAVRSLVALQKSCEITCDAGTEGVLSDSRPDYPLVIASNHQTFIDALVIVPLLWRYALPGMVGSFGAEAQELEPEEDHDHDHDHGHDQDEAAPASRATTPRKRRVVLLRRSLADRILPPWPGLWSHFEEWIFTAGSASLLFDRSAASATLCSILCGLPLQPRYSEAGGAAQPEALVARNRTQYLPDLVDVVRQGRRLLIFPEGRLVQSAVEPRDALGRWTNFNGKKNEPGGRVMAFYTGVGRIVAHAPGARVLPVGHSGLDAAMCADANGLYRLSEHRLRLGRAHVRVHFGEIIDFGPMVARWQEQHPHLSLADIGAADTMCAEKRALYRAITEAVRAEVVRCEALSYESSRRGGAGGASGSGGNGSKKGR